MDLHLRYRPRKFKDFIGNKAVVSSLMEALKNKKTFSHAILLDGPSGCGKTTLARILAEKLGCHPKEIHEINAANNRGIDFIRDIISKAKYNPVLGKRRVYIFDESHQLSKDAQNAMLKLIEDSPKRSYFIFCSTNPESMLKTIKTRCAQYTVKSLRPKDIEELLDYVIKKEKLKTKSKIKSLIVDACDGSPRMALVFLGMLKGVTKRKRAEELIYTKIADTEQAITLCRALMSNKSWKELSAILKGLDGQAYEKIRLSVLGYFTSVMMNGKNLGPYAELLDVFMEPLTYMNPKHDLFHRVCQIHLIWNQK